MKNKIISVVKKIEPILYKPEVFFILIAFLLIQLWFSKNLLFGGTEVGVPTYTPGKILDQIKWTWWEALGPGIVIPPTSASIPLYFFMSILERFGLTAIDIQKIIFFIIIYFQGLGASLVFKAIIPTKNRLSILAGLFYIFNPYMMTQIWHRFIYANFILSAALPFIIYSYLQLIEKRKFKFVFFFLLISLLSNYMYSSIAPIITIWLSVLVLYLSAIVINRKNFKSISSITALTITLFTLWILTNLWWLYPLINSKIIVNVFSIRSNVETLLGLSSQSTINNVVRGINPYSVFLEKDWGSIYETPIFQFLSWIPFLFTLVGLTLRKRIPKLWHIILLFLLGLFLAKGAAKPLGNFTAWVYSSIFILGSIRNPFEKLGLLVILPVSVLATTGINSLWNLYQKVFARFLIIILVLGCAVYVWPMWSDKLFGSHKYPLFFTLPEDYPEVSAFLSKELESDKGKILHLPISEGDSATYQWNYPYNGVELASHLFPGSSISRFLYISFIDQLLTDTAIIFHNRNYDLQRVLFSNFGIRYIVLNKNLDWNLRKVDNGEYAEKILDSSPDLQIIKATKNLKVYKFTKKINPDVFAANDLTLVSGIVAAEKGLDFVLGNLKENGVFLQPNQSQTPLFQLLKGEVISPRKVMANKVDLNVIAPRPYVNHLPDSKYYPLILLKEEIEFLLAPGYEKVDKRISATQKRLIEANQLKGQNNEKEFNQSIRRYKGYLDLALNQLQKLTNEGFEDSEQKKTILKIIFKEERGILESFLNYSQNQETKTVIEKSIRKITDFSKEAGLEAFYIYQDNGELPEDIIVYQFLIPEKKRAELIFTIPDPGIYEGDINRKIKIIIDGKNREVTMTKRGKFNLFSLGDVNFEAGIHEVALHIPDNKELVQIRNFIKKNGLVELGNYNQIRLTSYKDNGWVEYSIPNYDPNKKYILEFYYKVLKGSAPQLQFWIESDDPKKASEPKNTRVVPEDLYDQDWKYYSLTFGTNSDVSLHLDRSAINPIIRLFIPVWNDCEKLNKGNRRLCKNLQFKNFYNKQSIVEVRDLKIVESFNGYVFLNHGMDNKLPVASLDFKKISPVEYSGKINSDFSYTYLVLNEGFNNDWKVYLDANGKQFIDERNHFLTNGYANGWLIEKRGKISFKIKFILQDYLYMGALISLIVYLLVILFLIRPKQNGK